MSGDDFAHGRMLARRDGLLAILFAVMSTLCFALMDTSVKALTAGYPVIQVMFLRSVAALIILCYAIPVIGIDIALSIRRPLGHVARSLFGLAAMGCFFYAFSMLPLAEVYALGFAAPLFVTALSIPLLGERVGVRRWMAVGVGFIGVLIVLRPSGLVGAGIDALPPVLAGLGAALFYALTVLSIRALKASASATGTVLVFLVTASIVTGALVGPWWRPLAPGDLPLIMGMGLAGLGGQFFLTLAFRRAAASVVAPFEYTGLVWASVLGFLVFAEVPGVSVLVGGAVIVASGLYIARREMMAHADEDERFGWPRFKWWSRLRD